MTKEELLAIKIDPWDKALFRKICLNWDHLAKPLNGLGDFEEVSARIGSILRDKNIDVSHKAVIMMCADNGIIEEGVSQSGSEVTASVSELMGLGKSSVCQMAKTFGVKTYPVDIGIKDREKLTGVMDCKIAHGTKNFVKEPAMTDEECLDAIETGIKLVKNLSEGGIGIIATGEMGIGNTTTSGACTAALLGLTGKEIAGRGAGLSDEGLIRKISVIDAAIEKYDLYNQDPFTVLKTVGGLDIAGLCGVYLGGAIYHVPIVIDGFISATAALLTEYICPGAKEIMIASHKGAETGISIILDKLELSPLINGKMALGEGTGAVMIFPLLDMVLTLYKNGCKFADTDIEQYERQN